MKRRHALEVPSIRSSIELALRDFATREVSRVEIRVEGAVVTLEGCVASWSARQVIVEAVQATIGDAVVDAALLVWRSDRGPRTRSYTD